MRNWNRSSPGFQGSTAPVLLVAYVQPRGGGPMKGGLWNRGISQEGEARSTFFKRLGATEGDNFWRRR